MSASVPPLLFPTVLDSPGLWRELGTAHSLSNKDFQWLQHVRLATQALRSQQTPPMLAHRVLLNTENPPALPLAGSFILSATPEDRAFLLYTPFDGLRKFENLKALTTHLEKRLNEAGEEDRLLAFLALSQRQYLLKKRGITVACQLIDGDIFDDQRATFEHCQSLNAQALLDEMLHLPTLGTLLENILAELLTSTMPGVNQAQTRLDFHAGADSPDVTGPKRLLDSMTLPDAVLFYYRHGGWPTDQNHVFSHPHRTARAEDQKHWENAVKNISANLLARLYKQMEIYWNGASTDGSTRHAFFTQAIRQQALTDITLKRETGIIDAQKYADLLAWIEPDSDSPRLATLETVRLWEYQANFVELAGSLMFSHTDACLYTPSQGLQVLKDYQDLKNTLLSKFSAAGHEEELCGLLSLEERQQFLGFDKPHVSGETIAGDIFAILLAGIITKQRQNIEYALQVFRHSDGAVDIRALFDKALDVRSMLHERLLTLDTDERWSTRPVINGSLLPSRVAADAAAAEMKKFASVFSLISEEFSAQPITTPALQTLYLDTMKNKLAHALFVGMTGEARIRVLNGTLHRHEQAIVDTVFNPDQPDRTRRKGLNGFRPDAFSLSLQATGQSELSPLANCFLLTERGGLDNQHSGRAIVWTPALGLEAFGSIDAARQALNVRLLHPEKRLLLLENLSPLAQGFHQNFRLADFHLISENVMHDRVQSAIEQFLQRGKWVRERKLSKSIEEQALKNLNLQVIDSNLQQASALAKALGEQQSLPVWLGTAALGDQQLHLEILQQWRNSVTEDKDYLHGLPTLRDHLRQTLKSLLSSRFQAPDLDPQQIAVTPELALAGPAMSLTDFALNHSHIAQQTSFKVTSSSNAVLPKNLNQQAVRSLLLSLDIGSTFASKLTSALSAKDANAQARQQRYVRQLPWQLLQHAHQLKLQHRLSAVAFDLITQVLDMPDALARATVAGANALMRPLALIKTSGAKAITALGMYLIGPAPGEPGPQVLYAPYHGEQAFSEFADDAAVIAALNVPGALQNLLLRRLPDSEQSIFSALFKSSAGQPSEITLASKPVDGNALLQLFSDNLALLPRLLRSHSLPSAQADWDVAKNLCSSGIKLIRGLLPGKLAYVQFLWQAFKDFMDSAEALQDHHWKRALETFIAGAAEMITLGRLSLESTLVTEEASVEQAPVETPPSAPHWHQIRPTAASRTTLQTFETSTVVLKDLTHKAADGTYEDLKTKTLYAPIAGKVYPVEQPGAVWQIKGTEQAGPVLQRTASRQLMIDPDRHTVHFGKALSKMYHRHTTEREARVWLNIEAQGMAEIRARHPEKARMLTQAVDMARYYALNSLHNMAQLKNHAPGTRLDTFLKSFFGVQRVDADILAKIKKAIVPICNALVDPTEDLMNTDRFVVGSNRYRNTGLIAFVVDDDSRKRVHFTEKFFNQELDWYKVGLTQPFNVEGHAQASTLIHEFAHQASKALDIASLEARRPFADLIATITGYGAALKENQTRFQREALSLETPREELFSRWRRDLKEWVSLDEIPGTEHIAKEILNVTLSPTVEEARTAFLSTSNPHPRIDTILRNADSIAFLICEMGRQLDPVTSPGEALG